MHVMLIDDCDLTLRSTSRLLQREGYEVETFGPEVVEQLGPKSLAQFDVVVSDLQMGAVSGLDVLAVCREHWPHWRTRFAFHTGAPWAAYEHGVRAFEKGTHDLLSWLAAIDELVQLEAAVRGLSEAVMRIEERHG